MKKILKFIHCILGFHSHIKEYDTDLVITWRCKYCAHKIIHIKQTQNTKLD